MRTDAFSTCHPVVTFAFFASVIVLCVIVQQPALQAVGLVGTAIYHLVLHGRDAWRLLVGLALAFVILAAVNPLFDTLGDTVLFTYLHGRPYTLEALAYGASTACMFVTIMLWFACYVRVMDTGKFTYLFGGRAPALTLVLTMTLRLVPSYVRKARQIATARRCIGMSPKDGGLRQRVRDGIRLLSALTTWALEGSVTTADSMRSRGYGARDGRGSHARYLRYRLGVFGVALLAIMLACVTIVAVALGCGALAVSYVPAIAVAPLPPLGIAALVAYALLVLVPTAIDAKEAIAWRCSLSAI